MTSIATPRLPSKIEPAEPAFGRGRPWDLIVSIVAVAAMAGLAYARDVWFLQAAELCLLLTVPGLLLLRAVRAAPEAVSGFPVYILAASIAVIMGSGVAVDLAGPPLGVSRPLATTPLAASLALVCALLVAASAPGNAPGLRAYLGEGVRIRQAWPLLLALLAWVGAMRLTNGHGSAVAVVAVSTTGVALVAGAWMAQRWSTAQSAVLLFGAALALMWGFSLRGHFVYGFDISSEFQTFTRVLHAGRWHAAHHNDAYGAMLSLTVLPSTLTELTGASPLLVLKVIFPLIFAFFPVAVFLLASRVLSRRFAYLAVLFIVVQSYLFQQLPAIARQEIALIFFVCLVAAMLDSRMRRGSRIGMLGVFATGLVVSHYGTAYLTVGLFALALVLELARGLVMPQPRRLSVTALVAALAITTGAAAIWYEPVTDSAQNLSRFVSDLSSHGLSILPNSGNQSFVRSYLSGNVATRVNAREFASRIHYEYLKQRPYVHPLPQAYLPAFRVQNATVPGQRVNSHPALQALDAEQVLISQLAILLAVIGAVLLWLRRDAGDTARSLAMLSVATVAVLVFIRLSGTAANDYNQNRAFLQAMVPLSICLAWLLERASRQRRIGRAVVSVSALALGLVFLTTSGLRGTVVGGGRLTNLAAKGEDYERYYVTVPELAAARWLNSAAPPGGIVSTDRYGQLRITGATGRVQSVLPSVTPTSLDKFAWIYADTAAFLGARARGQDGSRYAIYVWPSLVGHYWDLVYSNGSSAVYARTH